MQILEISNEFFNQSIRIEQIIHIGTMCMDDAWPEIAEEAFEREEVWVALGIEEPDDVSTEAWGEAIRDACKLGFLVQFATPVPENFYEGGYSFSWGWYSTKWIYDESFESACKKAMEWRDEFVKTSATTAVSSTEKDYIEDFHHNEMVVPIEDKSDERPE